MYKELSVNTNSGNLKIFIQNGFFPGVCPAHFLHVHSFAELHIVTCENSVLNAGKKNHILNPGDMAVIPGGMYHRCVSNDYSSQHTAFQIDYSVDEFEIHNIGPDTANEFMNVIRKLEATEDYTVFAAYIPLLLSHLHKEPILKASPVTNRKFLINEFFSQRYSEDIHLSDLAEFLHVSERHAERLIISNMGKTFKEQLIHTRISTAKSLSQTSDMSLNEIAMHVGYKSYAGFWKALQKHDIS